MTWRRSRAAACNSEDCTSANATSPETREAQDQSSEHDPDRARRVVDGARVVPLATVRGRMDAACSSRCALPVVVTPCRPGEPGFDLTARSGTQSVRHSVASAVEDVIRARLGEILTSLMVTGSGLASTDGDRRARPAVGPAGPALARQTVCRFQSARHQPCRDEPAIASQTRGVPRVRSPTCAAVAHAAYQACTSVSTWLSPNDATM